MAKKVSAKAPVIAGKQYHIDCGPHDVAHTVLLPGDPGRVGKIASGWDEAHEVANHREYHTMTGMYKHTPISCTSTGIGAPSLAIAVEELSRVGVDTFIRVGTTGGLQKQHHLGDVIISSGAVRLDGASRDYVIPEYPAIAHFEVVGALVAAAEMLKIPYHVGITASTDTFYCGQGRPGFEGYFPSHKSHIVKDMQLAGVANFEMEASCLFTLASLFGKRAGAVCTVIANRVTNEFTITDEYQKRAGKVASLAVHILEGWDTEKKKMKKQWTVPAIIK
jgi:uridine phosphorylase